MKVRVIQHHDTSWRVEQWRWFWPFWPFWPFWMIAVEGYNDFESARAVADKLKNPTIVEIP